MSKSAAWQQSIRLMHFQSGSPMVINGILTQRERQLKDIHRGFNNERLSLRLIRITLTFFQLWPVEPLKLYFYPTKTLFVSLLIRKRIFIEFLSLGEQKETAPFNPLMYFTWSNFIFTIKYFPENYFAWHLLLTEK